MLGVVLGITYGALVGLLGNLVLFRVMAEAKARGKEPASAMGPVFFLRLVADFTLLVLFWLLTGSEFGLIAAGLSITIAVKVSLFIVYARKGGKFD